MFYDQNIDKMYSLIIFLKLFIILHSLSVHSDIAYASGSFSNLSTIYLQDEVSVSEIDSPKFFNSASQENVFDQQPQQQSGFKKDKNTPQGLQEISSLNQGIKSLQSNDKQAWNNIVRKLETIIYETEWTIDSSTDVEVVIEPIYECIANLFDAYDRFSRKSSDEISRLLHLTSLLSKEWKFTENEMVEYEQSASFNDRLEYHFVRNSIERLSKKYQKKFENVDAELQVALDCTMTVVCLKGLNGIFKNIPAGHPMIIVDNSCVKQNEETTRRMAQLQHLHVKFQNAIENTRVREYSIKAVDGGYLGRFAETPKSPSINEEGSVDFDWYLPIQIFAFVDDPLPLATTTVLPVSGTSVLTKGSTIGTEVVVPKKIIRETEHEIRTIYQSLSSEIHVSHYEVVLSRTEVLLESIVEKSEVVEAMETEVAVHISNTAYSIVDHFFTTTSVWESDSTNATFEAESTNKALNIMNSAAEIMNVKVDKEFEFRNESIFSRTERFDYVADSTLKFNISDHQFPVELEIPFKSLNLTQKPTGKPGVNFPKDVSATISAIMKNPKSGSLNVGDEKVNSKIFNVVLGKHSHLVDEFSFRIHHNDKLQFGDQSVCSSWNKSSLSWLSNGCRLNKGKSSRKSSVCHCSHTANFASIMDVSDREINESTKSVLTYIGSTFTILTAGLAAYLPQRYPHRRKKQNNKHGSSKFEQLRHLIVQNISGTLIVTHLFVMFGMNKTETSFICVLSAIFLFFFLLTTFVFMLLLLCLFFVTLFEVEFDWLAVEKRNILIAGYSLPAVVVIFSIIVIFAFESHNLNTDLCGEYFCWIASKDHPNNLWFFAVPVILLLLLCCILAGFLITKMFTHQKEEYKEIKIQKVLITFALFTITYGLPWLLFVFYINEKLRFFAWISVLINSCQGIMLLYSQAEAHWKELNIDFPSLKKMYRPQKKKNSADPVVHSRVRRGSLRKDSSLPMSDLKATVEASAPPQESSLPVSHSNEHARTSARLQKASLPVEHSNAVVIHSTHDSSLPAEHSNSVIVHSVQQSSLPVEDSMLSSSEHQIERSIVTVNNLVQNASLPAERPNVIVDTALQHFTLPVELSNTTVGTLVQQTINSTSEYQTSSTKEQKSRMVQISKIVGGVLKRTILAPPSDADSDSGSDSNSE